MWHSWVYIFLNSHLMFFVVQKLIVQSTGRCIINLGELCWCWFLFDWVVAECFPKAPTLDPVSSHLRIRPGAVWRPWSPCLQPEDRLPLWSGRCTDLHLLPRISLRRCNQAYVPGWGPPCVECTSAKVCGYVVSCFHLLVCVVTVHGVAWFYTSPFLLICSISSFIS